MAVGAAGIGTAGSLSESASTTSSNGGRVVDTHHHLMSPTFAAKKGSTLRAGAGSFTDLSWTPEKSLEVMDGAGVTRAILSLWSGTWFGDAVEARGLAREVNEFAADVVRKHPDRFGFFATIPLPDVEGSLAEIAYALDVLKADGVVLTTSYDKRYLGEEDFQPVYAELNRRGTVVYLHPTTCVCDRHVKELPNELLEYLFDTTRTIFSLLLSGTLSRTRNIKWLFSHGGGTLPMVAGRLCRYAESLPDIAKLVPDGPMKELQRLYYDTANVTHAPSLPGVRAMVPASQILFGSDFPYVPIAPQLERLRDSSLRPDELAQILCQNADRLMPDPALAKTA
ncbi:MAG TPA: amidohydrolase family protein [Allosphingosinicella sp.]|nr:amidohydrolase family protein [Allosphingosinicella sp.]